MARIETESPLEEAPETQDIPVAQNIYRLVSGVRPSNYRGLRPLMMQRSHRSRVGSKLRRTLHEALSGSFLGIGACMAGWRLWGGIGLYEYHGHTCRGPYMRELWKELTQVRGTCIYI